MHEDYQSIIKTLQIKFVAKLPSSAKIQLLSLTKTWAGLELGCKYHHVTVYCSITWWYLQPNPSLAHLFVTGNEATIFSGLGMPSYLCTQVRRCPWMVWSAWPYSARRLPPLDWRKQAPGWTSREQCSMSVVGMCQRRMRNQQDCPVGQEGNYFCMYIQSLEYSTQFTHCWEQDGLKTCKICEENPIIWR